jgi:hypothetical protein
LASILPNAVPIDQMRDTGQEDWRVMADYFTAHAPLKSDAVPFGRVHTTAADLGILYDDLSWTPQSRNAATGAITARIQVRVRNTGMKTSPAGDGASSGPRVSLLINDHGVNYAVTPSYRDAGTTQALPELAPGQSAILSWESVTLPQTLGLYALTARVVGNDSELNHSNDEVTRHFVADRLSVLRLPAHK